MKAYAYFSIFIALVAMILSGYKLINKSAESKGAMIALFLTGLLGLVTSLMQLGGR